MSQGKGQAALPMTEARLQAYVDGQLADGERAAVAAYLADNPAEFERIEAYLRQNRELSALFEEHAEAPLPARIKALGERLTAALATRRREG